MAHLVENGMRKATSIEMQYFSATTDMWSGRTREAFIALTIHYLTEEFIQRTTHRTTIEAFSKWGLFRENLTVMARDNDSNIVAWL